MVVQDQGLAADLDRLDPVLVRGALRVGGANGLARGRVRLLLDALGAGLDGVGGDDVDLRPLGERLRELEDQVDGVLVKPRWGIVLLA